MDIFSVTSYAGTQVVSLTFDWFHCGDPDSRAANNFT